MFGIFQVGNEAGEPVERFSEGADAGARAAALNAMEAERGSETRYRVKPIIDDSWKQRERNRLQWGEYRRLPEEVDRMAQRDYPEHYAHASKTEAGKVAFTESPEKGSQDRQTRKRAGAYLREYWPDLSDSEVQRLALLCDNEAKPRTVLFAESADDIEDVYIRGPNSCMSYGADSFSSSVHPVRAYAGYDLAVAYIESEDGRIVGRVLCWPDQKIYGTTYGDCERLEHALRLLDYSCDSLDGARFSKIEDGGRYVMPYIDDSYRAEDQGDHFTIDSCGSVHADRTDGTSGGEQCCECGYDTEDGVCYVDGDPYCCDCASYCEDCGEYVRNEDVTYVESASRYGTHLCRHCLEASYTECESCGEWTSDDEIINHEHGSHCSECFADNYTCCECCEATVEHDEAEYIEDEGAHYCSDCAEQWREDNSVEAVESFA